MGTENKTNPILLDPLNIFRKTSFWFDHYLYENLKNGQLLLHEFFDSSIPSVWKGCDGEKKWSGDKNRENSILLTSLLVDSLNGNRLQHRRSCQKLWTKAVDKIFEQTFWKNVVNKMCEKTVNKLWTKFLVNKRSE